MEDLSPSELLLNNEYNTFREIFHSSNEGVIVVDHTGKIQLANPTAEKLFGYESYELNGQNVDILVPLEHRANHHHNRNHYHKNPYPRGMGLGLDLLGCRKDGSKFPIEVSLSNVELQGLRFVVAFIIDISRRKKAEEALKRSEEQLITYATELELRVKRRTEDLNKTIEKLQRAEAEALQALAKEKELNELKSRFVSMASHEFRTPLTAMLSSVSLIAKYIETGQPEKADKHIQRIRSSVKNLTDILNDFLSLGKLEEGKIEVHYELLVLDELLQNLMIEMEPILRPGQQINLELHNDIEVVIDERLLRNVMINLISNASKYSPEGSKIFIRSKDTADHFYIDVEDKGMGIPKDEQHHLFERFFRAKNATNIQGTGLGLNIVAKYIDLLNGEINFKSEVNVGTIFTVKIPKKPSR